MGERDIALSAIKQRNR